MKREGRYSTGGLTEGEYEPGSNGRVLKNFHGIKSLQEIELLETSLLSKTLESLINAYDQSHRFTANDIRKIHKKWLGNIYSWAGQYRQINVSKGSFSFAGAYLIPKLMKDFEKYCLHKYTPCSFKSLDEITEALAIVHTELVLIHPFREGNGRMARILSTLMAIQTGLPILNFERLKGKEKQK